MQGDYHVFGNVIGTFLLAILLIVLVLAVRACAADARRRGKSPVLVTLMVVFFFPLGLIAWLVFRPAPMNRAGPRRPFQFEDAIGHSPEVASPMRRGGTAPRALP